MDRTTKQEALRRQAELLAQEGRDLLDPPTPEANLQLLHELRVHQIELEMQNEELVAAQLQLQAAQQRYFDLFELAPVGYCILSPKGLIVQANLTASNLLGLVRSQLLQQSMSRFIFKHDQGVYHELGQAISASDQPQSCQLRLLKSGGAPFWAHLEATSVQDGHGETLCRLVLSDIHQLKQAEEALRDSELLHRQMFQANPLPMWVYDMKTLAFLDVNAAALQHYGYTREQFLALSCAGFPPPGPSQEPQRLWPHQKKDGTPIWVQITSHRLLFGGRDAQVVLAHDVTESERSRASLALQARRAEALLELPLASERLGETEFMQRGQELAEDLTNSQVSFIHFVHPDEQSIELITWSRRTLQDYCQITSDRHYPVNQAGIWADALRLRRPVIFNDYNSYPHKHGLPPGHAPLHRLITVPVMEAGQVVMLAGVGNKTADYTPLDVETVQLMANAIWRIVQRRRTQQRLVQLSLAVEQSPHSVVITNLQAEIEYCNQAFLHCTGYPLEEVMGKNPRFLQSGHTPPDRFREMWAALTRGETWQGELQNQRKDGSQFTGWTLISPIRQADGQMSQYVGIQEDITEKKRLMEELEVHRDHLEELVALRTVELAEARQRAEAANLSKSSFLANMSHEIRTPLNAIVGLTHLLRSSGASAEQAQRLLQIDDAGHHLLSLISEILDLAKIEAGRFQLEETDFNLGALLDHLRSLVAAQTEARGLRLEIQGPAQTLWVRGDATRLRQALLNYTSNALKFTSQGQITVRCQPVEDTGETVLVRFEVQDTGVGIALEDQLRLFHAFEQLDATTTRKYGGTGLGLAITSRLAQLMGGQAGVESQPGQGSTFWFTARLGRVAGPVAAPIAPWQGDAPSLLRRDHAGARLLLAEDHPINREVATELLKSVGMQVDLAEDGRQALEKARQQSYDLILMDLQMPQMDGLAATMAIRALPDRPRIPILAVTANVFQEDRQACIEAGMDDFVAKPVDPNILYGKLLHWLSGRPAQATPPASSAPPTSGGLPPLPGCNVARGLAALGGNADKYVQLLRQLLEITDRSALQHVDLLVVIQEAHKLKGAAANLGADSISELAASIEAAARQGSSSPHEWLQLGRQFAVLAGALPAPRQRPLLKVSASPSAQSLAVLTRLQSLLMEGNSDALSLLEKEPDALQAMLGSQYPALERLVNGFQFEEALALLRTNSRPN